MSLKKCFLVLLSLLLTISTSNATIYTLNNSTTSGWTNNLIYNGSMWQGDYDGSLAIQYQNNPTVNMSGLVFSYGMGENGTLTIYNTNNPSGLVNTTNTGTYIGESTIPTGTGIIGNATLFEGTDDYVNIPNNPSLNVTSANTFTIELWLKSPNTSKLQIIYAHGLDATTGTFLLRFQSTGKIAALVAPATTTLASNTILSNNVWYHIVYVRNGTGAGKSSIFINGVLDASGGLAANCVDNSENKLIGQASSAQFLNGSVDAVRLWNRPLSATEISNIYTATLSNVAMPVLQNQQAQANYNFSNITVTYFLGNYLNNISIYGRQNGTTAWSLIQANAASNTLYTIPASQRFNAMDFGFLMQGNGNNTNFIQTITLEDTPLLRDISGYVNNTLGVPVDFVRVDLGAYSTYTRTMELVNNTNLAPAHNGTGERVNDTIYYATDTSIELHVYAHAMSVSETASTFVYIDEILVSPRSGRPLGGAETAYRGVDIIIPKGSSYRVVFQNYHHYEWREYPIVSGYYNFQNIPVGNYTLLFQQVGYDNNSQSVTIAGDAVINATLTPSVVDDDDSPSIAAGLFAFALVLILFRRTKRQNPS